MTAAATSRPAAFARLRSRLAAALTVAAIAGGALAVTGPASPAHAAAAVSVSVEGSPELTNVADPTYLTQLRLSGSGFQSIQSGFGGIYVMFGWVSGDGWQPSQGGSTGANYRYVPDDETNPTGYIAFVTFPGSSTAYAANGGELAADGSWSTVLSVPGSTFTALDREGNPSEVNCLEMQCGIITMGAHGVKNANNETFTPIDFRDLYSEGEAPAAAEAVEETAAPEPSETAAAVPQPAQTTYIVEEAAAPVAVADDEEDPLLQVLLWAALGVGVLAVGSIVFLVWAVLSSRRRRPAGATTGGGAS
ncbi:hypothetical protein [Microbacterium marinilacus]|uniref:Minor silk ampullate protein n=1 Tax=Microbacterium marinilacus TaxID=415209 RepID=A0ABP7BT09_9MICO|nr:hypothetical protein [Microbacterium marinilacus]MBY0688284.1 hypothetical protein [Microbacterium marinilacus]